jgi:MoxR-like ATPase
LARKDAGACPASILDRLGIVGMDEVEPLILASLIQQDPLLLIGPHGVGKSYLLTRLADALGIEHRHYNASLLNFDDLVGYPLPNSRGGLDYVQTPASIWNAQAVFIDEISRCRPEVQNKLFSIIHERRIQGLPLEKLIYRWSAMNPPSADGESEYTGWEPLDRALADRFPFIVGIPDWHGLPTAQQERLILSADAPPEQSSAGDLRAAVSAGLGLTARLQAKMGATLAAYVRSVCALLRQSGLVLSPRRAVMLLRNIVGVHAARSLASPSARAADSALLALRHSLPQRATGEPVKEVAVLAAHKEAWRAAEVPKDSPLEALMSEPDPLRRALAAARAGGIGKTEFSAIIADCIAVLPDGARHALALELFESSTAGRLVAAVAEQCAGWYALVATPQNVHESLASGSVRHRVWKRIVAQLAALPAGEPETALVSNLLTGLFATGQIDLEDGVDKVLDSWRQARMTIQTP